MREVVQFFYKAGVGVALVIGARFQFAVDFGQAFFYAFYFGKRTLDFPQQSVAVFEVYVLAKDSDFYIPVVRQSAFVRAQIT